MSCSTDFTSFQEEEQEEEAEAEGALIELSDGEDETLHLPPSESKSKADEEEEVVKTLYFVSQLNQFADNSNDHEICRKSCASLIK